MKLFKRSSLIFTLALTTMAVLSAQIVHAEKTVNAGTTLMVRMVEGVSSTDSAGKKFTCTFETDLKAVDGSVVAAAGTKVYGVVAKADSAKRVRGKSEIKLNLQQINIAGGLVPIVTDNYKQEGASEGKKTVKRGLAGAAIGGIADGSDGAKKGAAIGAGAGVVTKGEQVGVAPGSLLEFRLKAPLTVQ